MSEQLDRMERRLDGVYDRVYRIDSEINLLKWKVSAIGAFVGAVVSGIGAFIFK